MRRLPGERYWEEEREAERGQRPSWLPEPEEGGSSAREEDEKADYWGREGPPSS